MSLPLTRRIARAALLIAAGAAPVVGAAGAAGAAELPQAPQLGGLTTLDGAGLGKTLDGVAPQGKAGKSGGKVVGTTLPAATRTVEKAGHSATPVVRKTAGETAGTAGKLLGETAGSATGGLPTKGLPLG